MQFEDKIIANVLFDNEYALKIIPYTKSDYFEGDYKPIVDVITKFYIQYGTIPSKDEIKIEINNLKGLTDKQVVNIDSLIDQYQRDVTTDRKWLIDTTEKFYQKRSLTNAIINSASILEKDKENTNEILKLVQDALAVSFDSNLGHNYFEDINKRFEEYHTKEDKLPTGLIFLDRITLGGFSRKSLNCIIAPSGCHARGSKVVMSDGSLKKVEDIVVGDRLMGTNNEYRTVLRLCRGNQTMYKITPYRGNPFIVNGDHKLALWSYDHHRIDIQTVEEYLASSKNNKLIHCLVVNDKELEFDQKVDLPVDPYFLGIWLGDGSTYNLRITTQSQEIVDFLQDFCEKNDMDLNKLPNGSSKVSFNYALVKRHSRYNPLTEKMKSVGLYIGNEKQGRRRTKCEEKFIPEIYFHASVQDRYQLLAGLMDTDGHSNKTCYEYTSKSKQLRDDVQRLALSLGFACSLYQRPVNGVMYYRVMILGDIYKIPLKVIRKKSNHHRIQNKDPHHMSFTVEKLDNDDYYGFTLDGDHLYYSDEFVLNHNSGKSLALISLSCNMLRQGFNVLYITLEMSETRISERFDANLLDIDIPKLSEISLQSYTDRVNSIKHNVRGNLLIKEWPTGTINSNHIRAYLEEVKLKRGFIPDFVVVDYINLMNSSRYKAGMVNSYSMVKAVSEELRGLAVENNLVMMTATQTNRNGMGNSDIEQTDIADSIGLVFTLDMMFALIRTEALDSAGQVVIKQLKNRYCDLTREPTITCRLNRDRMMISDLESDPYSVKDPVTFAPQRKINSGHIDPVQPAFNKKSTPKNDFSDFTF